MGMENNKSSYGGGTVRNEAKRSQTVCNRVKYANEKHTHFDKKEY
jgi:hypothetical protein